jgi:F-box and leucine-rich repeat protein 10/11
MVQCATSFRQPFRHLSARYRSPSPPPREAIEPVSPGGEVIYQNWPPEQTASTTQGLGLTLGGIDLSHHGETTSGQQLWVDGYGQARIDPFNSNATRTNATRRSTYDEYGTTSRKSGSQKRDLKGHTRASSNIDALATIALATSPTFSQGSPSFPQSPWPPYTFGNGYQNDYTLDERPAKRARSEKLPSPQMSRKQLRPATSHVTSFESMKDDAELLLNFAQPHNFPPLRRSTPQQMPQFEQESPPYRRLSTSTTASEQMALPALDGIQQQNNDSQPVDPVTSTQVEDKETRSSLLDEGEGKDTKQEVGAAIEGVNRIEVTSSSAPPPQPQIPQSFVEQLAASAAESDVPEEKKPRRIQPTTQAPCAKCNSLQATVESEEQDGLTSWIGCNGCQRWFHFVCAGFKDSKEVRTVDKYICPDCEPVKGQTTYVRKSSRTRTAIDYAGLNQGMIQSSEETAEHHWLKPIKDGRIKFQPDDFARIRPEILTTDFLEKTDGMKRPVVIPASWNPQFGVKRVADTSMEEGDGPAEHEVLINSEGNESAANLSKSFFDDQEEVLECGQDLLNMVMPQNLTVRRVAELHGPEMPLDVIDVKSQQTAQKWNLKKWADYYESTGEKTIRNVISLEVSQSKLGRLLQRPKIVRDLDLQDAVWPLELPSKAVQFYCLMSVADCYTDFHIDFGGSSVYYHILKGKKTFFFIPPEEKHLKKYEQWNNSPLQNQTFLGDVTGDCSRVDLSEGDTMMIPSGWIHAVWTPENSLVIGGNFLTRMSYEMQIKVNRIEIDTKTALKFRYPLFQKVNWYTAIRYLEDDPVPEEVLNDFEDDPDHVFLRANPVWHEFGHLENDAEPGDSFYNARFYSRMEMEGLPALRDYLYRTALIASDFHVDGVTETTRTNVKKSIPKGHGEPMDLIRMFGIWVAWKTGCITAPDWVRPDSPSLSSLARKAEKQKKSDVRTPGERTSSRVQLQLEQARAEIADTSIKRQTPSVEPELAKDETKRPRRTPKTSGLGPQRFACDPCRKRRIRCRHREGEALAPTNDAERPRTYSSISVEIPQAVHAQSFTSLDGPPSPSQAHTSDPSAKTNSSSTSLPLQEVNGISNQQTPVPMQIQDSMVAGSSSGKKGRSKACEECRKSKVRYGNHSWYLSDPAQRRCIHDENGRVDPFKAAEPSRPRGSTSTKRPARLSDDFHTSTKKSKADDPGDDTILVGQAQFALAAALNEQAIEDDEFNSLIDPSLRPAIQQMQGAANVMPQSASEMNEAAGLDPKAEKASVNNPAEATTQAKVTIYIDPQLQKSTSIKTESHPIALATSSSQISANSLVSPPDSLRNGDDDFSSVDNNIERNKSVEMNGEGSSNESTANPLQTPKSAASRHSSRQPKPVDRYIPDTDGNQKSENSGKQSSVGTSNPPFVKKEPRRASSSGASIATTSNSNSNSHTGEGQKSRCASSHTTSTSTSTSAGFVSTTPPPPPPPPQQQQQQAGPLSSSSSSPPALKTSTPSARHSFGAATGHLRAEAQIEPDTDEESLKLIRALQEEEFGLRRRSMRA